VASRNEAGAPSVEGMSDYKWTPSTRDGETIADLSTEELVGQALGSASVCWSDLASAEFDSARCAAILQGLMAELNRRQSANLGMATTRELLLEIEARGEMLALAGQGLKSDVDAVKRGQDGTVLSAFMGSALRSCRRDVLEYRTVDRG
jgi:hypothetical protein